MAINVEFIEHEVLGHKVTFALDRDNTDWYFETVRKKPFANPVQHHLTQLRSVVGDSLRYADFGANIGVTSLFAAAMGIPTLAIEAGAPNFTLLMEAARKNGFGPLYRPVYIAASADIDILSFSENSAWGTLSKGAKATARVPTASIHDILTMHGFADAHLVKIDIEGAELSALEGFEPIANSTAPDLIVESNGVACHRFGYSAQMLWQRMIDLGYDVYLISGRALTRVDAQTAQTGVVEDVLATRRPAEELSGLFGYTIRTYDPAAARDKLADLQAANSANPKIAEFAERQLALVPGA